MIVDKYRVIYPIYFFFVLNIFEHLFTLNIYFLNLIIIKINKFELNSKMNTIVNNVTDLPLLQKSFIFNSDQIGKVKLLNKGFWNQEEQYKYILFLENNMEIMSFGFLRVQHSIFRKMAKFIKSRNTPQCKSHHQKMLLKGRGHLINIVKYYREKVYPRLINSRVFLNIEQELISNQTTTAKKELIDPIQTKIISSFYEITVKKNHFKIVIDEKSIKSY